MKKWKKFLIPAMCLFLVQAPASVSASAAISREANICKVSDENIQPAAASSSRVKKVVMKNGRYYLYQGKTKKKNCWYTYKGRTFYFGNKDGSAYAAPRLDGFKQNIIVKQIGKYKYGFNRYGAKVTSGVYANSKGRAYYFSPKGILNEKKSSQINKAAEYGESGKTLRKLLGKALKSRELDSCAPGVLKDVTLTYSHIVAQLGSLEDGSGEMVYGIQSR